MYWGILSTKLIGFWTLLLGEVSCCRAPFVPPVVLFFFVFVLLSSDTCGVTSMIKVQLKPKGEILGAVTVCRSWRLNFLRGESCCVRSCVRLLSSDDV